MAKVDEKVLSSNPFTALYAHLRVSVSTNALTFFSGAGILLGVFFVVSIIFGVVQLYDAIKFGSESDPLAYAADPTSMVIVFGLTLVGFLLFLYAAYIMYVYHIEVDENSLAGKQSKVGRVLKTAAKTFPKHLAAWVLAGLVALPGYILFILPGFYIAGRLMFASHVIYAEKVGPVAALKRSWQLSRGRVTEIYGTVLIASLLSGNGFVTMPLVSAAVGARYHLAKAIEDGIPAPNLSGWNWLVIGLNILFFLMLVGFIVLVFVLANLADPQAPVSV